jgi:hypothetical protein
MIAKVLLVVVSADIAESEPACSGSSLSFQYLMTLGTVAIVVVDAVYGVSVGLIDRVEIVYP